MKLSSFFNLALTVKIGNNCGRGHGADVLIRLNNSITGCVIGIELQFFNLADYEIFRINSACSRGYNNVAYFDFVVLCNLCQTGEIIVTIFSVSAYDSVVGSLFVNCRRFGCRAKELFLPDRL